MEKLFPTSASWMTFQTLIFEKAENFYDVSLVKTVTKSSNFKKTKAVVDGDLSFENQGEYLQQINQKLKMKQDQQPICIYIEKAKNEKDFGDMKQGQRISKRFNYNGQWFAVTIIKIPPRLTEPEEQKNDPDETQTEQGSALEQYKMQSQIQNQYILRNINLSILFNKAIIIQEGYLCLLSEFDLTSLNFKSRLILCESLAKGVKSLHQKLICHRNLSPSTICVVDRGDGQYMGKITNFEAAMKFQKRNRLTSNTNARNCIAKNNSKLFASPEINKMEKHGLATDIFSLGTIFNFILYETMKNIEEYAQIISVQLPEHTPTWIKNLLQSMLEYRPQKRPQIRTIVEVLRVSSTCADVLDKYTPYGKGNFVNSKSNK